MRMTGHIDKKLTALERSVAGQLPSSPVQLLASEAPPCSRAAPDRPTDSLDLICLYATDLGLHEQFDAARKNDGKLGNGPLMADEGRHPDAGLTKSDV